MGRTATSPSKSAQRAALDILRGRPRRRRREPTPAELANERRVFDELAELMEAGVVVDRSELVPPITDEEPTTSLGLQTSLVEQLALSVDDREEWRVCSACFWNWSRSCWAEGCFLDERAKRARSA
jgi:hypothetical protein